MGNPSCPALQKGCQDIDSTFCLHLNTMSLSPNSFFLSLTSRTAHNPLQPFRALLDSGSLHSFVNEAFALKNKLKFSYLPKVIPLRMFDGSTTSTVDRTCHIPIMFSTSESHALDLFVTKLDEEYSVVLGYDWLTQHNPSIDWVETKITFHNPKTPPETSSLAPKAMDIRLVSKRTMGRICHEAGSETFLLSPSGIQQMPNLFHTSLDQLEAKAASTAQPEDTLSRVPQEYHEFRNVFSGEKANVLAPHRPYDLKINLEEGTKPFHGPIYLLSPLELTVLREFLEENVRNGFICPSKSPWGSPVLFIKKKDGSLCLCVDFCALNRVTEKDHYPLPLIPDLLNSPGLARIYSKIDLKHAYHLVRIVEGDEPKTTFRTRYRSYEWRVMPFGLTNAPAVFQRFINEVLGNLLDICVVGYIDDILIYSDSIDQHRDHIQEVLRRLQEAGLYANPKKCNFHTDTVEYLGFILTPTGLHMDPAKVAAIQNWPEPRNVRDVQSFLGFTNI